MLDAEIYVDRIADMRVNDMNAVLEAVRQMVLMEHGEEADDLYLHTLKAAQIQDEEYFGHLVADDLSSILRDIREEHRTDALAADDDLSAAAVQKQLMEAVHFEGSSVSRKQRYNTLDFAEQNRVPRWTLSPLDTPAKSNAVSLWIPYANRDALAPFG